MDVSIVIPTKNAGKLLNRVLAMVFRQKTEYSYEVICVDSGSGDETLGIIPVSYTHLTLPTNSLV